MAGFVPAIQGSETPVVAGYVYILTSRSKGTLYVSLKSGLVRRVAKHHESAIKGFTKRYGLKRLVYFEVDEDIRTAIQGEKTMKHWSRTWKARLILSSNPQWNYLFDGLF